MNELVDKLLSNARSDLREREAALFACEKIIEYIERGGPEQCTRLTLNAFYKLLSDIEKESIKIALAYLCNSKYALIEVHFEYFPDENSPIPVSHKEVRDAIRSRLFVDPVTGVESEENLKNLKVIYSAKSEVFNG